VEDEKYTMKFQRGWLVLNPASEQVIVASGHNIPEYESERVITELRSMVQASR